MRYSHLSNKAQTMKRPLLVITGSCWLLFAAGSAAVLVRYCLKGAGLQLFGGLFSTITLSLGTVHIIGFALAALLSFAIGAGLCAYGMVKGER